MEEPYCHGTILHGRTRLTFVPGMATLEWGTARGEITPPGGALSQSDPPLGLWVSVGCPHKVIAAVCPADIQAGTARGVTIIVLLT